MVRAYFVTIGHYGFWLPNDERGSGSKYVGSKALLPYGEATYIAERRRSRASRAYHKQTRRFAKEALKYPPVYLTGQQAWCVAQGFKETIRTTGCPILAACVMPDHTHLVLPRHKYSVEKLVIQLKGDATQYLKAAGCHPFQNESPREDGRLPTIWGRGSWNVFLSEAWQVRRKIRYTKENPVKLGFPRQVWHFVTPFER